jgi:glycosyltransferase involved in cell wall biosynthesis
MTSVQHQGSQRKPHRGFSSQCALQQMTAPPEKRDEVCVAIVAQNCSLKMGGEAAIPFHYFRGLRMRGVNAYLVGHERNREAMEALLPGESDHMRWAPDTLIDQMLFHGGKVLPPRLSRATIGCIARLYEQRAERRMVKQLVKERGVNVVHQPIPVSPLEPSMIFGVGAPVVIGPMNGDMHYPPAFARRAGWLETSAVRLGRSLAGWANWLIPGKRRAQLLVVANHRTRLALARRIDRPMVELHENGVDMALWGPTCNQRPAMSSDRPVRFVFMGRLVDWKGVDLLLRAWASIGASAGPVELEIIGDGPHRVALQELIHKLSIPASVKFRGWLSQQQCAAALGSADVLVLPSLIECGAAVVLEAMAAGLPVIATDWGGPAEYLDASCGILVAPTSPDAFIAKFAEAMVTLARSQNLRQQMGEAGRQKVTQAFSWEQKVDQILVLYRRAVAAAQAARCDGSSTETKQHSVPQ